jgi:hypothetical protein
VCYYAGNALLSVGVVNMVALPAAKAVVAMLQEATMGKDSTNASAADRRLMKLHSHLIIFVREVRNNGEKHANKFRTCLPQHLNYTVRACLLTGFTNTLSCILFCVWPFLWRMVSYQAVFAWGSAYIVMVIATLLLQPSKSTSTSSRTSSRSGNNTVYASTPSSSVAPSEQG